MIKTDGVIFDIDGTIWDSTHIVKDAWNVAIKEAGYDDPHITAERLKGLFGLPMVDIITDIMPGLSQEDMLKLEPQIYKYEDEFLDARPGNFYEDIQLVIRTISEVIPVYIVSNCQAGYIELLMRKAGIEDCITDHLCPADTGMLKAANIKKIMDDYNISSPLYVGDTIMDQRSSKEAGCPFCFAKYGFGVAENPEYEIDKPMELLDLICLGV